MTNDEAEALLATLTEHYQCPVMPIRRYCTALRTWQTAIGERANRLRAELFPGIDGPYKDPKTETANAAYMAQRSAPDNYKLRAWEADSDAVDKVFRQISKSNLLARLLYGGEALRKVACPNHKGTWCGIEFSDNICPHGCQLTGWLREDKPSVQVTGLP